MVKDRSSKDNPISRSEINPNSLAQAVLFEQYRLLLMKQTAILILNRVISFVTIGFVAISTHLSLVQLFAVVLISAVIINTWLYERRVANSQAQTLADDLARQSGKGEMDFYIRSEYNVDRKAATRSLLSLASYEPQAWLILTIVFAILQYAFGPLLLH